MYAGLWLNNNKTGYVIILSKRYIIIYYSGFFLNNKELELYIVKLITLN